MIVKTAKAFQKACLLGSSSQDDVRCLGEKCMAWRRFGPDEGYCGMCPVEPDEMMDRGEVAYSEDF